MSPAAPMVPPQDCTQPKCQCRYPHHKDRRNAHDRRINFANPHAHKMTDRRDGGPSRKVSVPFNHRILNSSDCSPCRASSL